VRRQAGQAERDAALAWTQAALPDLSEIMGIRKESAVAAALCRRTPNRAVPVQATNNWMHCGERGERSAGRLPARLEKDHANRLAGRLPALLDHGQFPQSGTDTTKHHNVSGAVLSKLRVFTI
jgi:hypothetical protein